MQLRHRKHPANPYARSTHPLLLAYTYESAAARVVASSGSM